MKGQSGSPTNFRRPLSTKELGQEVTHETDLSGSFSGPNADARLIGAEPRKVCAAQLSVVGGERFPRGRDVEPCQTPCACAMPSPSLLARLPICGRNTRSRRT